MARDLTKLFEPHVALIYEEQRQLNNGIGVVVGEPEEPGMTVKKGDTVKFKRRPHAKKVTRGTTIDAFPTVADGPDGENREVVIDTEDYYGEDILYADSGLQYLTSADGQAEVVRILQSSVGLLANAMNASVLTGILPQVSMASGDPANALFQNPTPLTGAPWEVNNIYQRAGDILDRYGAPRDGRRMLLSNAQRVFAYSLPQNSNFDQGGSGAAAVRQGVMPMLNGFTTWNQPYNLTSATVSTTASFGYANEAANATAIVAGTPAVRDLTIDITADGANALDLKAGDVLYFTILATPLDAPELRRIQGYTVATDTAVPISSTVSVPITRSLRHEPSDPTSGPDVTAGMYLRGITSHAAGLAFQEDAVRLMMFPPWPVGSGAADVQAGVGPTIAVATLADIPIEQGGTGLTFWMRMVQGVEGFNVSVGALWGYEVIRPENILRVVTPPVA
jgi:hypothetical protein